MEKLEDLQSFVGQEIHLKVSTIREEYRGNLDEGETHWEQLVCVEDRYCVLQNIYQRVVKSKVLPEFMDVDNHSILGNQEGEEVLIPFHYCYGNKLTLRTFAENFHFKIDEVIPPSGDRLLMKGISVEKTFDGDRLVTPDYEKYTEENAARMQTFPLLAKHGCIYVRGRHAIIGDLERLLVGKQPLW
jgi:hypothetical protein